MPLPRSPNDICHLLRRPIVAGVETGRQFVTAEPGEQSGIAADRLAQGARPVSQKAIARAS